nr:cell division protein FtsQ/DivIB [Cellulomonas massiliensis]
MTTYTSSPGWRGPVRPAVVSDRSAERFAERARARRTLARRQVAVLGGGVVAAAAVGWLVLLSPVLRLDTDQVQVTGAGTVVAVDQVREAVEHYADVPLPRLDTVALRDAVLEVPGVREARVVRDWPHGLDVVLVAREPVAAVPAQRSGSGGASDEGYTLLDIDGVQVGRTDKPPRGLPVVSVPVGERRTLDAVLTVLEQLPPDLLEQVKDVSARTQDTVGMTLRDGTTVKWGSSAQTPLKIAVLQTLRSAPQTKKAKLVDVSAPTMPMTK